MELDDDDRRELLLFASQSLELAQDPPPGSYARGWMLDRVEEALDLAGSVDPVEAATLRYRWLEPLRAGRDVVGDVGDVAHVGLQG
jgi:hypothetical protein